MSRLRGPISTSLLALAIALGCTWSLPLRAQSQSQHGVDLRWDAPPECPTVADIYRELDRVLSRSSSESASRSIVASAKIVRTERGLREELHTLVDGRHGARTFEAPSCQSLARATVVFLALMVEPDALASDTLRETEHEQDPQTTNMSKPSEASPATSPNTTQPARANRNAENGDETDSLPAANVASHAVSSEPRHIVVELGGGLGVGSVPSPNAFLSGALGIQSGRYRAALDARWAPRRTLLSSAGTRRGGEFESMSLGLRGCYGSSNTAAVSFAGCVGGEAVRMRARGVGPDVIASTEHEVWLQFFGAGLVGWALTPKLGWAGRIDAGIPTLRREFTIDGVGSIRKVGPILARATLHFYAIF